MYRSIKKPSFLLNTVEINVMIKPLEMIENCLEKTESSVNNID